MKQSLSINDVWTMYDYGNIYGKNYYKIVYFKKINSKKIKKSIKDRVVVGFGGITTSEDFEEKFNKNSQIELLPQNENTDAILENVSNISNERFRQSLSRAKNTIFELALCNKFTHFCTFTQDKEKRDRYNLEEFISDFSMFVRNKNRNRAEDKKIKYVLVPEQHDNGAWHLHGLLAGLSKTDLVKNEYGYLDWLEYRNKFGFFSCSRIRKPINTAKYITKYISKDFAKTTLEKGRHLYYASQGLKRKEQICKQYGEKCSVDKWDFENEYVKIRFFSEDDIGEFLTF